MLPHYCLDAGPLYMNIKTTLRQLEASAFPHMGNINIP